MVTSITDLLEGMPARPVFDMVPGSWVETPEPDGTWKHWTGVRFHLPVYRFEGTPEEIGAEARALRETSPYPPWIDDQICAHLYITRLFETDTSGKYVVWLGFAVQPSEELLPTCLENGVPLLELWKKRPGLDEVLVRWIADHRTPEAQVKYPLMLEATALERFRLRTMKGSTDE